MEIRVVKFGFWIFSFVPSLFIFFSFPIGEIAHPLRKGDLQRGFFFESFKKVGCNCGKRSPKFLNFPHVSVRLLRVSVGKKTCLFHSFFFLKLQFKIY